MISTGEAWGHSVLPWLTVIAANTEKIQIGYGHPQTLSRDRPAPLRRNSRRSRRFPAAEWFADSVLRATW